MWEKSGQLIGLEESCHTLSCRFRNCEDYFTWVFIGAIRGMWEDPLCLGGDFNVLRVPRGEKQGR